MSDAEGDDTTTVPAAGDKMDINTALQEVLKMAIIHDGLVRGIRQCVQCLDKRQAHLCILANNCDEQSYVNLVEAMCTHHGISLMKVEDNKKLGEWSGLCKIDKEGNPRKIVAASCVVIKDYGQQTQALEVLQEYLKSKE